MTYPPVTPVTELVFFIRLRPSLSPLYTRFISTNIHYYQLYFVKFTLCKRENKLFKEFLERHSSSI